jgi:heme exporter protein CcmD
MGARNVARGGRLVSLPNFQFQSFHDFLSMGGDALFVWLSYGLFAVFVVWNLWIPAANRRQFLRMQKAKGIGQETVTKVTKENHIERA